MDAYRFRRRFMVCGDCVVRRIRTVSLGVFVRIEFFIARDDGAHFYIANCSKVVLG